jgi:NifB/MoaA-like Fe-S oxidoreductase
VHTQVVLCPEWNDGVHLQRTIDELWSIGPSVLSLSIVPVGLTQYNLNRPVRLLTPAEATIALDQIDAARERAVRERGTGWIYAGDEMFFIAGRDLPQDEYYDDWPLTENGVGAVRRLLDEFAAGIAGVGRHKDKRIAIATGTRMAPVMAPLAHRLAQRTRGDVTVVTVQNRMFGPTVTTAGLLPGEDIIADVNAAGIFDIVLLPAEALNDDDLFIDNVPLRDVRTALHGATIAPAHELTAALSTL